MNDNSAMFCLGLAVGAFLWTFTPNTTSKVEVTDRAYQYCSVNQGVQKMRLDFGGGKVWCNNGATFGLGD